MISNIYRTFRNQTIMMAGKKFFLFFFPGNFRIKIFTLFFLFSGTWKIVFSQPSSLFEHFTENSGLPSRKIFEAAQSLDGKIWFATGKGVCNFDGIVFKCFNLEEGLTESEITGIHLDGNGKLWCWSSAGRIFYFENNKFSGIKKNNELGDKTGGRIINSISVDTNKNIWVSTVIPGELFLVSAENTIEEIKMASDNKFSFFIKQTTDNSFVYGSLLCKSENNKLVVLLKNDTFYITLSEKESFSKISFFALKNGEYLLAKGQEIIRFKSGKIIQRSFTEKNVEDIIVDTEGKIWAGLYLGGVICYPEGKLSPAGIINYLGNKSVSSVMEDNSGNIWFTTMEDGVFFLPVRSNLKYSSPEIYSQKGGPKTDEKPKAIARFIDGNEKLNFNGTLRLISNDTTFQDTLPPAIFISGIRIMEKDTIIQTQYDLPFDKNFLRINFAGFSFSNSDELKYKYRMEGIDKAWIYSDNTFAQYTTLPPGKYFFRVSAMNKNGIWSDSTATVSFAINPPFWKTWWFISLMIFCGAAIIFSAFFIRITQIKDREKIKAEFNRQRANAELLALRAQMNPHFIFNTLSSIQHFITTNETEGALKYLSKFAKLMRKIMDNSTRATVPLKDEIEALHLYLELESLRFKNKFEYSITIGKNVDVNEDEIPTMLLQPYIENSILHGLLNKNKEGVKGKLAVDVKKNNGMIICSIEDNGIGREKSMEINLAKIKSHSSSGMSITKNRLKILNELHQSNLSVEITDLKTGGFPSGTKVEIFIPL